MSGVVPPLLPPLPVGLGPDYARVKLVTSFEELLDARFTNGVNALCWPRLVVGDFEQVMQQLGSSKGVVSLDEGKLQGLNVTVAGRAATDMMLQDLRRLQALGLEPELNCVHGYPRDESTLVPTDVYSFHVDRAPVEVDTWLCTYHGCASEGLRNDQALQRVKVPATRAQLLALFGGEDSDVFHEFLREHSYDLHYVPTADARPWSFGLGHLWRIATTWPGSSVPPCIHRAPAEFPDRGRLILIS